MKKFIPFVATVAGIASAGALIWYYSKSEEEQERLDRQAEKYGKKLLTDNALNAVGLAPVKAIYDEVKKLK